MCGYAGSATGRVRPYRKLGPGDPAANGTRSEAAGLVAAAGDQVAGITTGDRATVHSAPLREQGTWAEPHVAAAGHVAVLPAGVPFEAAAALPVPALTADQVIGDALQVRAGQTVLVHGAGGVTGGMLVQLPRTAGRPSSPPRARAARAGWLAAERDITMRAVQVAADGRRLGRLVQLLAQGLAHGFGRRQVPARAGRRRTGACQVRCPRLSHRAAGRRPRVRIMCPPLNTSH
jgi:hypothetical protein